jgi:hypothetical protein
VTTLAANPAAPPPSVSGEDAATMPAAPTETAPFTPSLSSPALLPLFLELQQDIEALAERTKIPLLDLLDWADSPPIRQKREALANLRQERLAAAEADGRIAAIATLKELAKTSEDPIERRRAAALLMRRSSLLPAGGGGGASPPVGAPSSTASTPSPSSLRASSASTGTSGPAGASSSPASLRHSVPASLPHDLLRRAITTPDTLAAYILKTLRAAPRDPETASRALYDCLTIPLKAQGRDNSFRPRFLLSGITTHLDHPATLHPAETTAPDERGDQTATAKLTFIAPSAANFTLHLARKRMWPHIEPYWALSDITKDSG